jgi:hypothetical protein
MNIEKIKQGLLKELDNTLKKRKRDGRSEDKEIELVIIHALDFIDDWTMETTGRELMNKYSEFKKQ